MLKRYTFWLTAAILFMFLTAAINGIALLFPIGSTDETGRQLVELLTTYKLEAGAGFAPTFYNLFTAYSACFSFLCLFGGLINGWLLLKQTEPSVMRGILAIDLFIFGAVLLVISMFTVLPLVICSILIFGNLLIAYLLAPKLDSAI